LEETSADFVKKKMAQNIKNTKNTQNKIWMRKGLNKPKWTLEWSSNIEVYYAFFNTSSMYK